jgi:hypothetical protein
MMDAIQSVQDVPLSQNYAVKSTRKIQEPSFIFEQPELSEASYPLLISYIEWLRKINAVHNQLDVMHENEQHLRNFKFLCKHNLFFFLKVTGQFKTIDRLFKIPSFATKLRCFLVFVNEVHYTQRQQKIKQLFVKSTQKKVTFQQNYWEHPMHGLFKRDQHHHLSIELVALCKENKQPSTPLENTMITQKHKNKQQQDNLSLQSEINWDVIEAYIDCFLSLLTQITESILINTLEGEQEILQKDCSILNRYGFFSPSAQQHQATMNVSANLNFFEEENVRSRLI